MFLKKIKIENYKILNKLDMAFDSSFNPTIFPLASLNGGGKSTLLQLVFILLNTAFSRNDNKIVFLKNMLKNIYTDKKDINNFSYFEIEYEKKKYYIDFYLANNNFENFNILTDLQKLENETKNGKFIQEYKIALDLFENFDEFSSPRRTFSRPSYMNKLIKLSNIGTSYHRNLFSEYEREGEKEKLKDFLISIIEYLQEKLKDLEENLNNIRIEATEVFNNLEVKELKYITNCNQETYLLYKTDLPHEVLLELERKIYLVAPGTQVFSFLNEKAKSTLFLSTVDNRLENVNDFYDFHVSKSKNVLTNFFTYDFASPTLIINSFKKARDKDFELAIESNTYEHENLKALKKDLDNFLLNKTISVNKDLTRVIFKMKKSDKELNPEDLSHGELKKLGLFIWFKYNHLNDAIILMDEVENGLHPDWQYSIIQDLEMWAPNNQFILATHSYELCQALTPSHISELNPKLLIHND